MRQGESQAWPSPWREAAGHTITRLDSVAALKCFAVIAKTPGGWHQNTLRHSFISYRVALTGDVPSTALEAGDSPNIFFRHYREVVDGEAAKAWFSLMPPEVWPPADWRLRFRRKPKAA